MRQKISYQHFVYGYAHISPMPDVLETSMGDLLLDSVCEGGSFTIPVFLFCCTLGGAGCQHYHLIVLPLLASLYNASVVDVCIAVHCYTLLHSPNSMNPH